jgi:PPM family protein phosphatase
MKVRPGVEVAGLTDIGCQRENNEDHYAYWESEDDAVFSRLGRLAIVADGMGGAEGGQHASRIAVETVRELYSAAGEEAPEQRLIAAFREANTRIQQEARENPALRGMGTTLTACAIVGQQLYYGHIGDSRLFLIRAGKARQLTQDHSLVARLIAAGSLRPEDAESHPQRNVLTAAIGVMDEVQPDCPAEPVSLQSGDTLVLCTDGLWGQVRSSELAVTVGKNPVADGARALVSLAKQRGGPDNITLQVLRIS